MMHKLPFWLIAVAIVWALAGSATAQPVEGVAEIYDDSAGQAWLSDWTQGPRDLTPQQIYEALPRFGAGLFGAPGEPSAPDGAPLANTPVPLDYVVGAGDRLSLRVHAGDWEHVDTTVTVSPEGLAQFPELGELTVAGQTLQDLREGLLRAYQVSYTDPAVTVTVAEQRVVEVYVTGDATRPGKYRLPGLATVFGALYACGGPAEIGSYRRLELHQRGREPVTVDLYDYLLEGRREQDLILQPGDTVHIPPAGPQVGLSGQVQRPARYELAGPASVAEALRMAGGLAPAAYTQGIQLWRSSDGRRWRLLRVNAALPDSPDLLEPLHAGDLLVVRAMGPSSANTVRILGAVKFPGYYPVAPGDRITDLLAQADGLASTAHLGAAVLLRSDENYHYEALPFDLRAALGGDPEANLLLQPHDVVRLFTQEQVEPEAVVHLTGAAQRPGSYPWAAQMRLSTLLFLAGGPAPGAYLPRAELLRVTPERRHRLLTVDLHAALQGDPEHDLVLERGDLLHLKLQREVGREPAVRIEGYVREGGQYPLREGMKVSSLIFAAGGLRPGAGPLVEVTHGHFEGRPRATRLHLDTSGETPALTPDLLLTDADSVSVTGRGDYRVEADLVHVQGRVARPGSYALDADTGRRDSVWDLLQESGGLLADANPRGIVVYRRREVGVSPPQEEDLSRVLQILNREHAQPPLQLQPGQTVDPAQQVQPMASTVAAGLQTVVGGRSSVALVLPPRAIREEDRVAAIPVDGAQLIATEGGEGDLELQAGDTVVVPLRVNTVTVLGAVPRPGSIAFREGRACGDYINDSGGFAEDAATDRLVVVHANGRVTPVRARDILQPGDVVVVPARHIVRTVRTESTFQQWLQTMVTLVTAALLF